MGNGEYAVAMKGIYKVYPDGVVALRGVDFYVERGEIHGLLGENGAGKTTLMRILYGEIKPTRGEIRVFGERVEFSGPWDAIRKGIGMVYQQFTLVPSFTVRENLYLSLLSVKPKATVEEAMEKAREAMSLTGLRIPLDRVVEELPVGVQQRVEIVKCLIRGAKILVLDEPTSVLTPIEVEELFAALRKLKASGVTIILITHKLKEAKEIADRITVMRRGLVVKTVNTSEVTERDLAKMMVERDVAFTVEKTPPKPSREALRVVDLKVRDDRGLVAVKGISLSVYEGEILGVAGVQGNGQKELAEAIAGIRPTESGRVLLYGVDVTRLPPAERYKLGLAYVPDSRREGLVLDLDIVENSVLTRVREYTSGKLGRILWSAAERTAREIVEKFEVLTIGLRIPVKYLSGGNQQKVMVGREVLREPKVLVVSEPTQGLDVAATEFIRKTLLGLRDQGKAILLISTDLDEVLQLSDRIAVLYEGQVMAVGKPEDFTLEKLGLLMGGVRG